MAKIIQYHSAVISRDGVGNSIFFLHHELSVAGVESYIACADAQIHTASPGVLPASSIIAGQLNGFFDENDVLLIHFSFHDDTAERLARLPIRCIMIYHNITPGHFFRDVGLEWLGYACDAGRDQFKRLAPHFDAAVGVSDFNSCELKDAGFKNVSTIPILLDASGFRREDIDPALFLEIREAADINILFVGRFVPNKRIEYLIDTLAQYSKAFPRTINLHLVGKMWDEKYFASLISRAAQASVTHNIKFHFNATQQRLRTLYAAADAFVCMSEHEGFMIPIVEAFTAGCPVIAANAGAIGETMGGAGVLMPSADPTLAAGLIHMIATDRELRRRVIAGQAQRAADFRPASATKQWLRTIRTVSPDF